MHKSNRLQVVQAHPLQNNYKGRDLISDKRFIFICGVHRSGTSLLHSILRSHPDMSGFVDTDAIEDEGQHLQTVYPTDNAFGGPGYFGYRSESFMDENHWLATPENAEILFQEWSVFWDLNKPFLLEKSPPNIVRTRFLQKLFPNSCFVVILRHPIAVAYATQKWCQATPLSLIEHTLRCYERCWEDISHLERVCVLHYEEFVGDPGYMIRAITGWLRIQSYEIKQAVQPNRNISYFSKWNRDRRDILKGLVGDFKGWSKNSKIYERRANRFGYSMLTPEQVTFSVLNDLRPSDK